MLEPLHPWLSKMHLVKIRPPPRGRFGRRSPRNSYDFALSVREGEDDFALFFGDFRNVLSVLLVPVSRFFACLQQTLTNTVALMIANSDTPTTTSCLQKHDIITLIGTVHIPLSNPVITSVDVISDPQWIPCNHP